VGELELRGIDVHKGDALQPIAARHRHVAPVREPRHGEARDPVERLLVVEAGGHQRARLREEALRVLGALDLGDVLDHVDHEPAGDRPGLDHAPALLPRVAAHAADHERLRRLAAEDGAAGQVLELQWGARLGEGLEGVHDRLRRRVDQLLRRVEAEARGGGGVGVDEAAVGALDGDGVRKAVERRRQARLDALQAGEQAGVLERERDAAGEQLRELQLIRRVRAMGGGEPHRADVAPA
jgi:hypothetical protein